VTAAAALCAALLAQAPGEAAAPEAPPDRAAEATPAPPPSLAGVALGAWATRIGGFGVTGAGARLGYSRSAYLPGAERPSFVEFGLEVDRGRTAVGLPVAGIVPSLTVWSSPARRVRAGFGLELGAIVIRRATTGTWHPGVLEGVRAALHWDALATERTIAFVELSGDARLLLGAASPEQGLTGSAVLLVGVAYRNARPAPIATAATP
jgi:hypothetical protein